MFKITTGWLVQNFWWLILSLAGAWYFHFTVRGIKWLEIGVYEMIVETVLLGSLVFLLITVYPLRMIFISILAVSLLFGIWFLLKFYQAWDEYQDDDEG